MAQRKDRDTWRLHCHRRMHTYILRGDTVVETKATLKVFRTIVKRVLLYSMTETAPLSLLPWTQVTNVISKGTLFCCYVPAKD